MTTPSPEQRDPGWLKKQLDAAVAEVATWHPGMRRAYDGMTVEQIREAEKKRMAEPLTDERIEFLKHEASQLGLLSEGQVLALIAALQEARREVEIYKRISGESQEHAKQADARAHAAERIAADKSAECERLRNELKQAEDDRGRLQRRVTLFETGCAFHGDCALAAALKESPHG